MGLDKIKSPANLIHSMAIPNVVKGVSGSGSRPLTK